jgi:hypothetical protein
MASPALSGIVKQGQAAIASAVVQSRKISRSEKLGGRQRYREKSVGPAIVRDVFARHSNALGPDDEASSRERTIQDRRLGQIGALGYYPLEEGAELGPKSDQNPETFFGPSESFISSQSVLYAGPAPPELGTGEIPQQIEPMNILP